MKSIESSPSMINLDEQVQRSDHFPLSENSRAFEYKLNEKSAKSKLIKGAKRIPLELEENSNSSNLVFSVGAWKNVVLPAISYWKDVGMGSCKVGDKIVKVGGVKAGVDTSGNNVDNQMVFFLDRNKIVCHLYHTTQLILVNGHGFKNLIDAFSSILIFG